MQKVEKHLQSSIQKLKSSDFFGPNYLNKLDVNRNLLKIKSNCLKKNVSKLIIILLIFLFYHQTNILNDSNCLIYMPMSSSKWFREPETCKICNSIKEIDRIERITPAMFYKNYIETAKPVVVIDGAKSWLALERFDFMFFKTLYKNFDENVDSSCQFFPYKTEFRSLNEALNMDMKRAELAPGQKPWYIGWSNCNNNAGKVLREYYDLPYFLPNTSENIALNWLFMGGPGQGAHMHVDNVNFPSWQAQIKGRKLWRLAPPPECYYNCIQMEVEVKPGDIIVLDTNRWYHETFILWGDISITIGSEFD